MSYLMDAFDYLNNNPEPGWKEYKTSAFLAKKLKELGLEVHEKVGSDTGLIGILDTGKEGPVIGLRADMDALTYEKDGEVYYRHACGHSAHSAMVLTAAKDLVDNPPQKGKVVFIFQPAEEVLGGAVSMVESGQLDQLDEIMGIHLRPKNETPYGQMTPALIHGSSYMIEATVKGQPAHGARPHLGVNAIEVSVSIIEALKRYPFDPSVAHSLKVTKIHGGQTSNIIPDTCHLTLDVRCETNELMQEMLETIQKVAKGIAQSLGGDIVFDTIGGVPAAEFDDDMIETAREAITEVFGSAYPEMKTVGGEDFHYYTQLLKIPSVYVGLGCDLVPGLHDPDMTFKHDAMIDGKNVLVKMIRKRLEG